jgi:hypothetical protein
MSSSRYFCLRCFVLVTWASRDSSSKRRTRRSASMSFSCCAARSLAVGACDVCCRSRRLSIGDVSPLSCGSDGDGSLRSGDSCEPRRTRVRVRVRGARWLWLRLTGFWRLAIRSIVRLRRSHDAGGRADEKRPRSTQLTVDVESLTLEMRMKQDDHLLTSMGCRAAVF